MRYTVIVIFLISMLNAQVPEGYYDGTDGLTGMELKSALHEIIKDHVCFPYSSSNTDVWDILKETDGDPANQANVILFYTGWSVDGEQEYNNGNGWNREHVWPLSHGSFSTGMGPGTDVHHIRPSDIWVNNARGNKDFDNGGVEYIAPDGPSGCYQTTYTWEPRDEVKGDVARMIFYTVVRYEGGQGEPDLEMVDFAPSAPNNEPLHGVFSTLYEWHIQDPVDDWERNRNDVIYYNYQQNRNPFIDNPEFAASIWFPLNIDDEILSEPDFALTANYPNPFNPSTTIDFEVRTENAVTLTIHNLKGQRLEQIEFGKGSHSYLWNAQGKSSGIYFYSLVSPTFSQTYKMILLK